MTKFGSTLMTEQGRAPYAESVLGAVAQAIETIRELPPEGCAGTS